MGYYVMVLMLKLCTQCFSFVTTYIQLYKAPWLTLTGLFGFDRQPKISYIDYICKQGMCAPSTDSSAQHLWLFFEVILVC
jgi:hypothetical protein